MGGFFLACVTALLLSHPLAVSAQEGVNNWTTPVSFFYSRPDLLPNALQVTIHDPAATAENELVFISPYQTVQAGPEIYDRSGNLVWAGWATAGPFNGHNLHTCQYQGSTHLCMFQGNQLHGYARGQGVIMNTDYEIVKTVQSGGEAVPLDQHEFKVINDGASALVTIYQPQAHDLSRVSISRNQGWILDSIFQEVNVTDGSVIFEWNALDNVDPYLTYVYPRGSDIAGDGLGPLSAWDFFHLNSIDKSTLTGNYLISARHMGTIFNINATDGSIIWRLQAGGDSDFECVDFNFSFQHDAQIRAESPTSMTISLYDNSFNNINRTANRSEAKIVRLDYDTKTARLAAPTYFYPEQVILSASQGNAQQLHNGNVFVGYGSWPHMSEHLPDGTPVWAAHFGPIDGVVMSYRTTSGEWHAIPKKTKPSLWTYARDVDEMMVFYVSWNGCTEVASWNFWCADDPDDEFTNIGSIDKAGFETQYTSDTHFDFAFAEAIGYDGTSLRNSSIRQTFVPSAELAASCGDRSCPGV